jgi:DNA-binding NarL/FixJ family response regulator
MKQGTVLLADRHSPMLEGVRNLLEGCFQAVVMVADEASLFRAAQGLQPACAIVDVSFPCSDGDVGNVVSRLHRLAPDLKVIAISVHDERVVAERMLELGALGFVVKGAAVTDLLPAINAVMSGQTYVSGSVHPKMRSQASERGLLSDGLPIRPT